MGKNGRLIIFSKNSSYYLFEFNLSELNLNKMRISPLNVDAHIASEFTTV